MAQECFHQQEDSWKVEQEQVGELWAEKRQAQELGWPKGAPKVEIAQGARKGLVEH